MEEGLLIAELDLSSLSLKDEGENYGSSQVLNVKNRDYACVFIAITSIIT